ncbi:RHS repeat-associated protein [Luteibacter sp. W1I16]|uniref:RHS repeat-associated core domain-containing protein n=1 Tax=Luteibacter sp. W1I16 TaxID=3373922 RepID=UPI003D1B5A7E
MTYGSAKQRAFLTAALVMTSTAGAANVQYYYTDELGSVLMITDASGVVVDLTDYRPYGSKGLDPMPGPGFSGAMQEPETSLIYMQARYMDTEIGRFISRDPFSSEFNQYAYASNNPIILKDPTGLYTCKGSKAECERFENGLAEIKSVVSTLQTSDLSKGRLVSVLKAYGSKGDGNGVSVTFSQAGPLGVTSLHQDGSVNVNLDFAKLDETIGPDGPGYSNRIETAAAIAHEGQHVFDGLGRFDLATKRGVVLDEANAFRTQADLNQAARSISRWGLWSPDASPGDVRAAIVDNAKVAADQICKRRQCK